MKSNTERIEKLERITKWQTEEILYLFGENVQREIEISGLENQIKELALEQRLEKLAKEIELLKIQVRI